MRQGSAFHPFVMTWKQGLPRSRGAIEALLMSQEDDSSHQSITSIDFSMNNDVNFRT
jgi:hypothetical protein